MGQTGMESLEIIRGIVQETNPKLIIVIDALASRSVQRLNTTVQLTDTGISPGSGVGNNRKAINQQNLGTKVIAIGVPTVVDAATIVADTLGNYMHNMFVTPKNIDESIKRISFTVSEALNECFAGSF